MIVLLSSTTCPVQTHSTSRVSLHNSSPFLFCVFLFSILTLQSLTSTIDKIKDLQQKRLAIAVAEKQLNDLFRKDADKVSASSTGQKRVSKLSKTKKPAG